MTLFPFPDAPRRMDIDKMPWKNRTRKAFFESAITHVNAGPPLSPPVATGRDLR